MKSNVVSTASFFVLILISVLALAAAVAADWRPFERTTPGLRADVESNRFALPDAVLGLPFEDMRQFMIQRTRWQIENDWRLRQRFRTPQRRLASEVFEHLVASNYYEDEFRRMLRNNVMADFSRLGGYLRVTIAYTGDNTIEDAVLRVLGARYARVAAGAAADNKRAGWGPLSIAARAEEHHPGNDILAPPAGPAGEADTAADDAAPEAPATATASERQAVQPRDAPLVNQGAAVRLVDNARIALGRLRSGDSRTVDVWVADLNRDPQWAWTEKVTLTHRDGAGRVTFHQPVNPLLERFDRNPLIVIGAVTALLLIAFAIVLLWFVGLFARRRPAAA
jgi:hypothetical protein